jgi:hypothetical protein
MWEALSTENPHRQLGLEILNKLQQLQFDSLPTSELAFNASLSPAHVIRDLSAQQRPRYRNQLLDADNDNDDAMFCDFVAGWVALANDPGADVNDICQTPFAASDIPSSERGLDTCGIQYPEMFNDPDICVRPVAFASNLRTFRLATTISPAGSITDPHIDGTGSGLLLLELFGTKVLFTWPASTENLRWMDNQHGIKRGPLKLLRAMDEMSQMCVNVLTAHKSVELAPGMIHAVISPNNSAISGWDFINARWLLSSDVQRQMLWEVALAKKQKEGLLGDRYNMQRYLEEDIELWNLLVRREGPHTERINVLTGTICAAMQVP